MAEWTKRMWRIGPRFSSPQEFMEHKDEVLAVLPGRVYGYPFAWELVDGMVYEIPRDSGYRGHRMSGLPDAAVYIYVGEAERKGEVYDLVMFAKRKLG